MEKVDQTLAEIRAIKEKLYEEDKDLSPEEVVAKIRKQSDAFLKKHNLNLKRVSFKDIAKTA